jgi:hypothetical protein
MRMEEKKTEVPDFPINQQLLEDATKIKEQWRVVRDRLEKIEASRSDVTPEVYERVKNDYQKRLEEVTKQLMDKKQDIDGELESLYATRSKIAEQLEEQRHALEEVKFRNTLGEFTDEEYQKLGRERQDMITKFETAMNAVTTNISRYESLFHEEAELLGVEAATPDLEKAEEGGEEELPEEEISEAREFAERGEQPLETDEEGYIINETERPDYFAGAEATGETDLGKPAGEESETVRAPEGPTEPQKVLPRARVVIISGDQAGAAYPLKDTVTLGRADSNTIALKDAKTSRQHAQIQQHGNQFILVDLNSSNGTYVNGQRIEEHVLQNNDEIQIGDYILQFQE